MDILEILFFLLTLATAVSPAFGGPLGAWPPAEEPIAQVIQSARAAGSPDAELWRRGHDPRWREAMFNWLTGDGGRVDRAILTAYLDWAHRKTPIPNLHQVDEKLWRGGQPDAEGWRDLHDQDGVSIEINLRDEDDSEAPDVAAAGLREVYLPIRDTDIPTPQQVLDFFGALQDAGSGAVFVHCASGAMRTGTMVGLYELFGGRAYKDTLKEALGDGFDPGWLHGYREEQLLKNFSRNPRRWLELAEALPADRRGDVLQTLAIQPERP